MKFFFLILLSLLAVFPAESFSQNKNPEMVSSDTSSVKKHSPAMAALFSSVIPGAGQVYNGKYWKVPVVYGGLLTAAYFLKFNQKEYSYFKENYIAEVDTSAETVNVSGFSREGLQSYMDLYRTRMEISAIAIGLIYVLNIVDAAVDAHLFTFDVTDNLSMRIAPEFKMASSSSAPVTGLKLTLNL